MLLGHPRTPCTSKPPNPQKICVNLRNLRIKESTALPPRTPWTSKQPIKTKICGNLRNLRIKKHRRRNGGAPRMIAAGTAASREGHTKAHHSCGGSPQSGTICGSPSSSRDLWARRPGMVQRAAFQACTGGSVPWTAALQKSSISS